ncbi:small terminase protein [uncultured Caudovirales phage]|uniref:Small terminase protein n=1 Tax=uncultured Caudovirales phage TaxID=2100421 RepID=A0A6J5L034_9CAUD|nr:small terminase protein [uncultured Caudovirales phage]
MNIDNNMNKIFDLEPAEYTEIPKKKTDIIVGEPEKAIDNDFDHARDNLYDLLETGKDALLDMLEVAKQSEHPRSYEVVGNLLKQLADMNQQLLDIHAQKRKLEPGAMKEQSTSVTNNAIFVGSTNELQKLINNMNTGEQ